MADFSLPAQELCSVATCWFCYMVTQEFLPCAVKMYVIYITSVRVKLFRE